jgi:hypothetical protein
MVILAVVTTGLVGVTVTPAAAAARPVPDTQSVEGSIIPDEFCSVFGQNAGKWVTVHFLASYTTYRTILASRNGNPVYGDSTRVIANQPNDTPLFLYNSEWEVELWLGREPNLQRRLAYWEGVINC